MKKYRGLKPYLLVILVFLGMGAVMLAASGRALFLRTAVTPVALNELDFESDISGVLVRTRLYGLYGAYSQTVSSKSRKVKSREYVTDAGGYHYIALKAYGSQMKQADALMEASLDFLDKKTTTGDLEAYQYEVTGTIKPLKNESLLHYQRFFGWNTLDEHMKDAVLPYYLDIGDVGGMNPGTMWCMMAMGAFFSGLGLFILATPAVSYGRTIKKFKAASQDARTEERIRDFLEHTPETYGVQIDRNYIFLQAGSLRFYLDTPDHVVWAYKRVVSHRYNGIPTGKSYGISIAFANHKQYEIPVKDERQADELMVLLNRYCTRAAYGYSDQLKELYKKNFSQFLNLHYNQTSES